MVGYDEVIRLADNNPQNLPKERIAQIKQMADKAVMNGQLSNIFLVHILGDKAAAEYASK